MDTSQLVAASQPQPHTPTTSSKQDDNLDKNKKPAPSAKLNFFGRALEGIRSSFRQTAQNKRSIDDTNSGAYSTSIMDRKRSRTDPTLNLHLEIPAALDHGATIRNKVHELAWGEIALDTFMGWYKPEQARVVSTVAIYNQFKSIKKRLEQLVALADKLSLFTDKPVNLKEKESHNHDAIEAVEEEQKDIDKKMRDKIDDISHSFKEIKKLSCCLPKESAKEIDSPSQLNLGLCLSLSDKNEKDAQQDFTDHCNHEPCPYLQLMDNPAFALDLNKKPETYKVITARLMYFIRQCEVNILVEGRTLPKELSEEGCRKFFFSCCPWEPEDIDLIRQLQNIRPQKHVIFHLTTLICDNFTERTLIEKTSHSWLATRENKYREEAKQARGQCVLEKKIYGIAQLQNIIARPAGVRYDISFLIEKIPELIDRADTQRARKKLVNLRKNAEDFLTDQSRNRDLLEANNFILQCYYSLRSILTGFSTPPEWSKHWPYKYADFLKASGEKKPIPNTSSEAENNSLPQHKTSPLKQSNSSLHLIEP